MSNSDLDRLEAFARRTSPPKQEKAEVRVPAINQRTLYWAGGFVAVAVLYLIIVKVTAGTTFVGDLLFMGGMGLTACALIYCLSALGAYLYRQHKEGSSKPAGAWVAALVRERQFVAASDEAGDFVFLELVDGRRVRLEPKSEKAKATKAGDIGWAQYRGETLFDFAPE
ncbi:hypothetical protein [Ponticaulis sp.]|uniref:hypothetical protein n=1 Tax=Ponticaulis sp. TaxID=2020902 RepID=UPI000C5A948D|nr:hypothetical protein [Ponticaulis sp.]MAF57528.1 hypothetical protein [Ponticaulis sp.]MBN02597.1 hypothetical protein [Ponticaulis sp.]|tara:strand:+ start:289 stop:795 length:507 start_codon:yes stop_codon:yes gene_type:complete